MKLVSNFRLLLGKFKQYKVEFRHLSIIRSSGLFDKSWYLAHNPDVAQSKVNPLLHYLRYGGFEGRDPSSRFCSAFYLDTNPDVKSARINPLVHYLMYGKAEGRYTTQPSKHRCSVCSIKIHGFFPISTYFEENRRKNGYPFTFNDLETMNANQYSCPSCGASDRDRLYALYINKALEQNSSTNGLALLDIAPSAPLRMFLLKSPNIKYQSADRYMEDVDIVLDITDMNVVQTGSFDIFICSHVLEHVDDDKKALSELFRILRPGGFGILMVPIIPKISEIDEDITVTDTAERWRRFGQDDHVRLYSKKGFMERAEAAGFVIKQYGVDFFGEDIFFQYGISPKSILYVVEKNN